MRAAGSGACAAALRPRHDRQGGAAGAAWRLWDGPAGVVCQGGRLTQVPTHALDPLSPAYLPSPQQAAAIFGDNEVLSVKVVMKKVSRGVVRRARASSTRASMAGSAASLRAKAKKGEVEGWRGQCAGRRRCCAPLLLAD